MNIRFTHLAKSLFVLTFLFFAIENIAQTSQTITSTQNWTCPAGVTSVSVQAWGAGGGGGSNANGGGGGGGGAFRLNSSVTVIPGTTYTITIGNGGAGGTNANGSAGGITTATFGATTVTANGGSGGLSFGNGATGGAGGTGGTFNGGNGANGSSSQSGGGGGGAGTTTNGSAGSGITGGAGGSLNGGTGGNGTTANNANGSNGNTYGGGGGGSTRSSTGGSGANGAVILTYTCPTITVSAGPNQTLAACATTATLAGSAIPSGMTGTWTVVSGSASITTPTSPTSGITAIPQGSSVTLRWTISNGVCGSAFSDVTITTPLGPGCLTYCTPSTTTCSAVCVPGNFACYDIITNVTLGTLNNNSGTTTCAAGGYQNFTALSPPTLTIGLNHTIQITTGNAPGNHVAGVWIDYNQNGVLNDAGEYFEIGNAIGANATVNQTFQVPTTALLGNTRMRIRYVAALSLLSSHGCNTSATFGETEDYTVNIVCATASLNTVTGRFPANGLALPCGAATTLSWDAHTCATSGFDVYLGTTNPPTTLVASTSGTTYYTGNLLGNTTYFWRIVPKAGPSTGASTVWSFTTQTPINTAFSQDTSGCSGSTLCLQASGGTYPDYYWYNVPVNGTPLGTGSSYCPPAITTPTTFYVSNVFQGPASSIATATASGIVCGSNNPSNGNMFDIQAKTANLNITALEVMFRNLGTGGSGTRTAKVYYRQSSFVGNASSSAGWILLGTYSVTVPNSPTAPTFIDIADFFVPAGQIYGVYVVYDNDYASGANVYSNVDIEVRTGSSLCGAGSEFAGEIPDRSFRGRVYYNITCSSPTIPVVATPWTSNGLVALTPVTRTGLTERCVENGWTYYSHSSAPNQWLFAINKNGNNFTATADVTVGSPANNVYENVNAPG